jgi:hypothetical protein
MPVKTVTLSFPPSASADVTGYNLYIEEAPAPVTYDSEKIDMGNITSVDISTLPGMTTKDGVYNIAITSYDSAGNESSMTPMNDVNLDFVEPDPPGAITIIRT